MDTRARERATEWGRVRTRLWQWVSGSAGRERRRVAILAQHPYVNRADHEPLAAVKVATASLVTFHSEIL